MTPAGKTDNKKAARRIINGAFLVLIFAGLTVYFANKRQAEAPPPPSRLTSLVMDEANILAPDFRAQAGAKLSTLEAIGGPQIVVATERRLQGATIADDALEHARRWRIGHAGRNDGALLLIVESARKARIEVGYGLEGVLTDAASRVIIAERMEAHLRAGEWTQAAQSGLDGVLAIVHPAPIEPPKPTRLYELGQTAGIALFGVVIVLIALGVIQAIALAIPGVDRRLARSKRWGWISRWRVLGGGGGGSSSSGGSGSSGGGGSFGGGGAND